MVDYIADYLENIRDRRVFPDVKPGYMRDLVPENAPMDGEKWENIFNDVETVIMPGVTLSNSFLNHTIRKVKFLSKNSILTKLYNFLRKSQLSTTKKCKATTFSRVFHPKFVDNFSREIKVVNS